MYVKWRLRNHNQRELATRYFTITQGGQSGTPGNLHASERKVHNITKPGLNRTSTHFKYFKFNRKIWWCLAWKKKISFCQMRFLLTSLTFIAVEVPATTVTLLFTAGARDSAIGVPVAWPINTAERGDIWAPTRYFEWNRLTFQKLLGLSFQVLND